MKHYHSEPIWLEIGKIDVHPFYPPVHDPVHDLSLVVFYHLNASNHRLTIFETCCHLLRRSNFTLKHLMCFVTTSEQPVFVAVKPEQLPIFATCTTVAGAGR